MLARLSQSQPAQSADVIARTMGALALITPAVNHLHLPSELANGAPTNTSSGYNYGHPIFLIARPRPGRIAPPPAAAAAGAVATTSHAVQPPLGQPGRRGDRAHWRS